ncbi:MAG: lon-related putative ATP-dependent protease [Planctomycetota bacterium]|jgi:lon-related putative ATP-dependent protease
MTSLPEPKRLDTEDLRWHCDASSLDFKTTAEVEPLQDFVGQEGAAEALAFGLATFARGQNVYVRGMPETGRLTLVKRVLETLPRSCPLSPDHVYVYNFELPDHPRLLSVPRGRGRELEDGMEQWISFVRTDLGLALNDEKLRRRREALQESFQEQLGELRAPLEAELTSADLGLVTTSAGDQMRTMLLPVIDGETLAPEVIQEYVKSGKLTQEDVTAIEAKIKTYGKKLQELGRQLQERQGEHGQRMRRIMQDEARVLLDEATRALRERFPEPDTRSFLDDCIAEVVKRGVPQSEQELEGWLRRFQVNVVNSHSEDSPCPFVIESTPTLGNLLGGIERKILSGGATVSDHLMISAGSLLRADGGYLILEARDVVNEPGAWKVLVRALRTGQLEIVPSERQGAWGGRTIKPAPIPLNVKVVLIGEPSLYYALDSGDPDFGHLFKVLADFDTVLPRNDGVVAAYGRYVAQLADRDETVMHFTADAVARLAEHGARIAGRKDRLTARFGRLADIVREASFVAQLRKAEIVDREHVHNAILRTRRRADLPARNYRENISDGTINIQTSGTCIGQVNGLATMTAGPLTFGFPSRITATIGAGMSGAVDIERESQLSGRIHTKGFHILRGLLRHLLQTQHPLAFSSSIAFEQSYGGIDGDSASGAEMCCMLSALTGIPLRQDLAMTGAIDQHGAIQAIGGASAKIEGFFAVCRELGLTGTQGIILPQANVRDLMLDEEVVEACREGRFHVYPVRTIQEALEVFTGVPAGERDEHGDYANGTLLATAVDKAFDYWSLASAHPDMFEDVAGITENEEKGLEGAAAEPTAD